MGVGGGGGGGGWGSSKQRTAQCYYVIPANDKGNHVRIPFIYFFFFHAYGRD